MFFDFLLDVGNYDTRVVAHSEIGDLVVDTARVSDGLRPFETGIQHPEYHDGKWIIVEAYDSKEDAASGHERWIKLMVENPPIEIRDCQNAEITLLGEALGVDYTYSRQAK